ncbi:heterokaryon incompatibility protein-domain-containing protein [Rhexocercosporidium sp. MPI-PUGE-AT-0058]|nr:heterokaryon incompatibility protein-domain-containing protein [Rhexocercosporidium sp. MPI-PUGE-AT-0058]
MDPKTKDLCEHCVKLIPPKTTSPHSNHDHHATLALLELSSTSCPLCAAIVTLWSLENVQGRYPDVKKETYTEILVEIKVLEAQSSDDSLAWGLISVEFEIRQYAMIYVNKISITTCRSSTKQDSKLEALAAPIIPATFVHDSLVTVRSWLHECRSSHPHCIPANGQTPKRLIDVGLASISPKLVECRALSNKSLRYATLSYCWGLTTFKTTKETVDAYSRMLPYHDLPKTYQDAILIAWSVGIKYLWIDALCIVQDDNSEWQQEASRMQNIYAGSDLTIAATDASDGSVGCFPPRRAGFLSNGRSDTVIFTTKDSAPDQVYIVQVDVGDSRQGTNDSVLNTRGWTLQEMVLSHRILHCMSSSLLWQCKTYFRSEMGLTFDYSTPAMRHNLFSALDSKSTEMNRYWWTWMESYSRREFTFPSDRLPAMAGLVRHYQATSQDEPMLGLWERSFTQDLLWMRLGGLNKQPLVSHSTKIPSWSWLACPAIITFDNWGPSADESQKEKFQVITDHSSLIDWNIEWSSEPLVSNVKSCRVVIEGPVLALTFNSSSESLKFTPPYLNINDETLDLEMTGVPWRCSAQFDVFEAKDRVFPARYLCLLLRSSVNKSGNYTKETFLILEPIADLNSTYRRIGIGGIGGEKGTFALEMRQRLELV